MSHLPILLILRSEIVQIRILIDFNSSSELKVKFLYLYYYISLYHGI